MDKLYYSIGEVARILGENVSLVRYWSDGPFRDFFNPKRNAKGNRMYTAGDVERFKEIHTLVRVKGMTLDGARMRLLSEKESAGVASATRMLYLLKEIRSDLAAARESLGRFGRGKDKNE